MKVSKRDFAGFELGNKFPRQASVLGPILDAHQLKLISGWFSGQLLERSVEEEIEAIQDHLTLLKELGATVMVYCEVGGCIHGAQDTPLSQRPVMQDDQWPEFGKETQRCCTILPRSGGTVSLPSPYGNRCSIAS